LAEKSCSFFAEGSRLNPESVLLEGSIRLSQGSRVRLDLSQCPEFRLFPGQVVVVKGTNPSGFCIVAEEITGGVSLGMQKTQPEKLASFCEATGKEALLCSRSGGR
jgi:hypothetical protein